MIVHNLVRMSIHEICSLRGLFPPSHFASKRLPRLEGKPVLPGLCCSRLAFLCTSQFADLPVNELIRGSSAEVDMLCEWVEQGVGDALHRRYLRRLYFGIASDPESKHLLEEYIFEFSYRGDRIEMDLMAPKGRPEQDSAVRLVGQEDLKVQMVRTMRLLVSIVKTLDAVPRERYLFMKMSYNDSVPPEYEPPHFEPAEDNVVGLFPQAPIHIKVGAVDAGFNRVSVKVKSVLDHGVGLGDEPTTSLLLPPASGPQTAGQQEADLTHTKQAPSSTTALTAGGAPEIQSQQALEEFSFGGKGGAGAGAVGPGAAAGGGSQRSLEMWGAPRKQQQGDTEDASLGRALQGLVVRGPLAEEDGSQRSPLKALPDPWDQLQEALHKTGGRSKPPLPSRLTTPAREQGWRAAGTRAAAFRLSPAFHRLAAGPDTASKGYETLTFARRGRRSSLEPLPQPRDGLDEEAEPEAELPSRKRKTSVSQTIRAPRPRTQG